MQVIGSFLSELYVFWKILDTCGFNEAGQIGVRFIPPPFVQQTPVLKLLFSTSLDGVMLFICRQFSWIKTEGSQAYKKTGLCYAGSDGSEV